MTNAGWRVMDKALRHWICCLPILLLFAHLSARQIDIYPPTVDEFYSMANAGWLVDGANSPLDILDSLARNSPNHTPLYFLLLGLWGDLTTPDIALARTLSILIAIPALAMIYRLGSDFIGGPGGLFAVVIAASNAYVNFHVAFARMYTLLLLLSAIVLWLYLRLTHGRREGRWRDYLALGAAVYLLANTFLFSAMFLLTLGAAHGTQRRDRRFWRVALAVCGGLLLFLPWLAVVIPDGFNRFSHVKTDYLDGIGALYAWLMVYSNGALWLPLLAVAGLLLGFRRGLIKLPKTLLLLCPIFLLLLLLAATVFDFAAIDTMRYHIAGFLPFLILLAAGLAALYRAHAALVALPLLWLAAALAFPASDAWDEAISGRALQFTREPMHAISREAIREAIPPIVISYKSDHFIFEFPTNINYSQRDHYFTAPGLTLEAVDELPTFETTLRFHAITAPAIWLVYQHANLDAGEPAQLTEILNALHYKRCKSAKLGPETHLVKFSWSLLDCAPPTPHLGAQNDLVKYEFYGAKLDDRGDAIVFVDRWHAAGESAHDHIAMSWKLMTPGWDSVAQLDLPLVHQGALRQFTLNVSDVLPGAYAFALVVYDQRDGETHDWNDYPSEMPAFLRLATVTIE